MEKDKKKKTLFLKQPEYSGGPKAMTKFIYENLRFPQAALEANVEGSVYLEYDIDYKGNVVEVRVLKSLGHGCDEEAIRVIKMLKFDVEATRGLRVLFHKKSNIQFKKAPQPKAQPSVQAAQGQVQINYSYLPTTPQETEPKPQNQQNTTYTYQLFG